MGKQIFTKYTIFEVKQHLSEIEKKYGKEAFEKLLGKEKTDEINREFEKEVTLRLEPYWKDIQDYEHGGFWARLRVRVKYILRERRAECDVPKHVLQAIVDDMLPDIRAFFESEEGKREFEEWKAEREKKAAEKNRKPMQGDGDHIKAD